MRSIKPESKRTIGEWTWNSDTLLKKVVKGTEEECWTWTGSTGPHSNLFGAIKNGRRQMTQATRILYRELYNEDVDGYEIQHTCKNKYCVNPSHWRKYKIQSGKWWKE